MKAVVQERYGPPEVLELRDIERPSAEPGEVLVRVRAASVDAGVAHLMRGTPLVVRAAGFGLRAPKTPVRGMDVAGVVEAVGAGVTTFAVGDEVFGTCGGAFAEYATAKVGRLARKPANLTFEQAAAIPVSATSALQALGSVGAGDRVAVIGAAGGVGSFAVLLAVAAGAHVTGVCSTAKVEAVRALGADEVVDYTRESLPPGAYTRIVDTAGSRRLAELRRALTPKGALVIVGGEGGGRVLGGLGRTLRAGLLSPFVGQRLGGMMAVQREADLEKLRALAEAGKLTPLIDRVYPLGAVPDAVRYMEQGHACGKVIITF